MVVCLCIGPVMDWSRMCPASRLVASGVSSSPQRPWVGWRGFGKCMISWFNKFLPTRCIMCYNEGSRSRWNLKAAVCLWTVTISFSNPLSEKFWILFCHSLRTQMQGQFKVKMFIFFKTKGRLRISTQSKQKAVKLLSTPLNKYGWGECGYEN